MNSPQKKENWLIKFGEVVNKPVYRIVKIESNNEEYFPVNWRYKDFKCIYDGQILLVSGHNFICNIGNIIGNGYEKIAELEMIDYTGSFNFEDIKKCKWTSNEVIDLISIVINKYDIVNKNKTVPPCNHINTVQLYTRSGDFYGEYCNDCNIIID